ncbi:MAG: UvrD-helicase domain-containing protein [Aeriscardovia sp.]|nr:UvrD-helicase domain-containing protein [Aeriscardovia sp.]
MKPAEALLSGLDPAQREAARCLEGTLCLRAGAGSGKTSTVSARIALGLERGRWDPSKTLAIAFSRRAAQALRSRLLSVGAPEKVKVSTFHSLALAQLRRLWSLLALSPFPLLLDEAGSLALFEKAFGPGPRAAQFFSALKWAKSSLVGPGELEEASSYSSFPLPRGFKEAWETYEKAKKAAGKIDFGDIFILLLHILETSLEARRLVSGAFQSVTADEYQDVSPAEHAILKFWAAGAESVCVVGDPAQTIYSFTGSSSWFLSHAQGDFPPPYREIALLSNYRSGREVIRCANGILALSPERYSPLRPGLKIRGAVERRSFKDLPSLARAAAGLAKGRDPAKSFAILARTYRDLDALASALSLARVPFGPPGCEGEGRIALSTLHAAKGLEWDEVVLAIGTERGGKEEEERRTLYVGATRAKERLFIFFLPSPCNLSRFLPFSPSKGR